MEKNPAVNDALISVYECAIDPDKFPEFVENMENWLLGRSDPADLDRVETTSNSLWAKLTFEHSVLLRQTEAKPEAPKFVLRSIERCVDKPEEWDAFQHLIFAPDLIRLRDWMAGAPLGSETLIRTLTSDGGSTVCIVKNTGHDFHVTDTDVPLGQSVEALIQSSFNITHSEVLVLRKLVVGHTVKEISQDLGKSLETVRTQVKSISQKLSVKRQQDIQRVVGNIRHKTEASPAPANRYNEGAQHVLIRPHNRSLHYVTYGAATGFPILVCTDFSGGSHLPKGTESSFAKFGLRAICVVRAGYGASDPVAVEGKDLIHSHCEDYEAVASDLGLERFSVLGIGTGMALAFSLAKRRPDRVQSVVGLNVYPPILSHADALEFKSGMYRMGALASLYAPSTLRLLTKFVISQTARIKNTAQFLALSNSKQEKLSSERSYFRDYLQPNLDDILIAQGKGAAADCTYLSVDWARVSGQGEALPPIWILHHHDFPFVTAAFAERFAKRLHAKFTLVPHAFRESHLHVQPLASLLAASTRLK